MTRRAGAGGRAAVAAATALAVGSLVGGTLYVSSVGNEALQLQLAGTCLTDAGATLGLHESASSASLGATAASVAHVQAPIVTRQTPALDVIPAGSTPPESAVLPSMVLLARDGQAAALGLPEPGPGEVLVPDWAVADVPGDATGRIDVLPPQGLIEFRDDGSVAPVEFAGGPLLTLRVVGTYPDIPVRPEPSFWCGQRDLLRPDSDGDRPPPMAIVAAATLDALPAGVFRTWELRPVPDGLRRDEARTMVAAFAAVAADAGYVVGDPATLTTDDGRPLSQLPTLVARADRIAEFVARTIAPVRYAAALAALALLVGAGVLVVRDQRRELRLRAVRGVGPAGLAAGQLRWLVPVTLAGAVAGGAVALVGVRLVGPTPELDPGALRTGAWFAVAGWAACLLLVATVIGAVGAALVDRPAPARRARTWFVPELVLGALAVWSFSRLDRIGGVRQSGTELRGGDLVAQAFPLLAAVAGTALLVRPARFLLRRARRSGSRLPPAVLVGWRRVTSEPGVSVTIGAATALATAFAVQAGALTDSVERLLHDKAAVFVGADLVIDAVDPPDAATAGLGESVTVVNRLNPRAPSGVEVLGVDPATFAAVAFWRDDADDRSLDDLLRAIGGSPRADGRVPALVVGDEPSTTRVDLAGEYADLDLEVVGTPAFFPGFRNGRTLVVVDRAVLGEAATTGGAEVWIDGPVDDATAALRAEGIRVRGVQDAAEVFAVTDFLSTRWGYASFTALGAVIAVVTLLGQLLVLDARRSTRRVAHVLVRRMGMGRGGEAVAVGVEVGVPLVGGALAGTAVGWVAARLATSRLDSLRNLKPTAVLVVDPASIGVAGAAVVAAVTLLALAGVIGLVRTRAMEVMRAISG